MQHKIYLTALPLSPKKGRGGEIALVYARGDKCEAVKSGNLCAQ